MTSGQDKSIQDVREKIFTSRYSDLEAQIEDIKNAINQCNQQINELRGNLVRENDPKTREKWRESLKQVQSLRNDYKQDRKEFEKQLIELVEEHVRLEEAEVDQLKEAVSDNLPTETKVEADDVIEKREQHVDAHRKQSESLQQKLGTSPQETPGKEHQPKKQNTPDLNVLPDAYPTAETGKSSEQSVRSSQKPKIRKHPEVRISSAEAPSPSPGQGSHSADRFPQVIRTSRRQWLPVALVALISSAIIPTIGRVVWTFRGKQLSLSQCNQELEITGNTVEDWETTSRILSGCEKNRGFFPNNVDTLINAGRASLLRWYPELSSPEKQRVVNQTEAFFDTAVVVATQENSLRLGQTLFYQGIMQDFERFVLREDYTCTEAHKAEKIYGPALEYYQREDSTISKEDYFPILELAHFLMHRDQNYRTAQALLEKAVATALNNQASEDERQLYKALLLNKAKTETHLDQFTHAKASLEKALEYEPNSYKIKLDLAAVSAHIAVEGTAIGDQVRFDNLQDAIKYYEEIISTEATDNIYQAWRNLSFLYYLRQDSRAIQSFKEITTESKRFDSKVALEADAANKDFILFYQELAQRKCYVQGQCTDVNGNPEQLRTELRDKGLFDNYFITHNVIEDEFSDPFIDLEHDSFYKCNQV